MANLIDPTYFIREISIPNNSGIEQINLSINSNINSFIGIYEPEFLTTLLGSILYAEFLAGLAIISTDQKWINLKSKLLQSIANYVYFKYSKNEISKGQLNDKPTFFNNQRSVNSWNEMVKQNKLFFAFMVENKEIYTTFDSSFSDKFVNLFITINTFGI